MSEGKSKSFPPSSVSPRSSPHTNSDVGVYALNLSSVGNHVIVFNCTAAFWFFHECQRITACEFTGILYLVLITHKFLGKIWMILMLTATWLKSRLDGPMDGLGSNKILWGRTGRTGSPTTYCCIDFAQRLIHIVGCWMLFWPRYVIEGYSGESLACWVSGLQICEPLWIMILLCLSID